MNYRLRSLFLIVFVTLFLTGGQSPREIQPSVKRGYIVESFEFGVFDKHGKLVPTTDVVVSNTPSYGWRLKLRTDLPKITWREVITLPAPAQTWGVGNTTVVSANKTSATTTQISDVIDGRVVIGRFWGYAPGDPFGRYVTEAFVENDRVRTVAFTVRP